MPTWLLCSGALCQAGQSIVPMHRCVHMHTCTAGTPNEIRLPQSYADQAARPFPYCYHVFRIKDSGNIFQ